MIPFLLESEDVYFHDVHATHGHAEELARLIEDGAVTEAQSRTFVRKLRGRSIEHEIVFEQLLEKRAQGVPHEEGAWIRMKMFLDCTGAFKIFEWPGRTVGRFQLDEGRKWYYIEKR